MYKKKEYHFTVTKEDLQKRTPEQLAHIMINQIERELFMDCMKAVTSEITIGIKEVKNNAKTRFQK